MTSRRAHEDVSNRAGEHPPPFDPWAWTQAYAQTWAAGLDPKNTGRALRERRLADLIDATLRGSPFYRRRVGSGARRLADFAPVSKPELMHEFDHWATDRRITRAGVDAFIADPACVAQSWLGDYLVWTSSGTSGHCGVFVQDRASLAAYDALDALRLRGAGGNPMALGLWGIGRSFAFVGATGGHFAGNVNFERLRRVVPALLAPTTQVISVLEPVERIAERLSTIQPDVLITYPSCAIALANLQTQGGPRIAPAEIWLGGEQLSGAQRQSIEAALGGRVRNAYGASEFFSIAFECAQGRLHLNDDWVILEALDSELRPVPCGVLSSITLLTNLANRTQPLVRYVLDDQIRYDPERCACGCAFPVIEVCGRADDTLHLAGRNGSQVAILPLALETAIEEATGVTRFQVVCNADGQLELRLEPTVPGRAATGEACRVSITAFLDRHAVADISIALSKRAPVRQPGSGKLRRVISGGP